MDKELRTELAKPFGCVYSLAGALRILQERKGLLIAVGDRSVYNLLEMNPDICIYDRKCRRKPIPKKILEKIEKYCWGRISVVKNPRSRITPNLEMEIRRRIRRKKGAIRVDGEEDLASLVCCAYAPIGSNIAYGQPGRGIVLVKISKEKKDEAKLLLRRVKESTRIAKLL